MKRLFFVSLIILICSSAEGQNIRYDTIRYAKKYYAKRVAIFKKEPLTTGRIIFLGDSQFEFGDWRKLLNDSTVVNRGVAADNTFGVLDRLEDVIARRPGRLFIEIGINDIAQNIPAEITAKNISTIIERVRAQSPETRFYVQSVLPANDNCKKEYPEVYNKNEQVTLLNNLVKQNAKPDRYTYIDLNKVLRDKDGKLDIKYAKPDGLHLNKTGYEKWVGLLRRNKCL